MHKDVQKILENLEARESKNRAAIDKAASEVRATHAKLLELRGALENAGGREEYVKIAAEIRDNEAALEFCERKEKEARENVLSKEEFESINKQLLEIFQKTKAEHKKAIKAEIDKLEKLFAAYDDERNELHAVMIKAAAMANEITASEAATATPLFDAGKENGTLYPHIVAAYNRYAAAGIMKKNAEIIAKKGGAK